ncbi:YibE/F family protein [Niameybacter massiliensis]|uniref:YibE/F family protein n=1 Tax=Holtiella tumoricola TaxID=3018743 RepID=A0AA42DRI7_9FIRM|nr:YibE/F family protein [Holtiella tumoricola]MDA3733995.1 YibE/F family protein [Holtiella tumoricola]
MNKGLGWIKKRLAESFGEGRLVVLILMVVIAIGVMLMPAARRDTDTGVQFDTQYAYEKCRILEADDYDIDEDPYVEGIYIGRQNLQLEILTGEFSGEIIELENTVNRKYNYYAREGRSMVVQVASREGELLNVQVFSYSRDTMIYVLLASFILVLLVIGRRKGFFALLSLMFVMILICYFMIPMVLKGYSPILIALIIAGLTTVFNIILVSGSNKKSWAAILGIVSGLVVATLVGMLFGKLMDLSGINMEHAEEMMRLAGEGRLQVKEILFAGIIIASLGAIMDVGMSIASSVFEVHTVSPKMNVYALYKSGMNVGRDVMGTMTNTLILAYAGSSLSTLMLFYMYQFTYYRLINIDLLGMEILQGIAGSIGLILTIPITAWIAASLAKKAKKS